MSEGPSAYTERTEGPSMEQTDSSGVLVMSPSQPSNVCCSARWWCRWNDWRWGGKTERKKGREKGRKGGGRVLYVTSLRGVSGCVMTTQLWYTSQ